MNQIIIHNKNSALIIPINFSGAASGQHYKTTLQFYCYASFTVIEIDAFYFIWISSAVQRCLVKKS